MSVVEFQPHRFPPEKAGADADGWETDTLKLGDQGSAKRAFLRMASHELRTPLNSIIGFSEILRDELYGPMGSPHYVEYAEIIRGSGVKLLNLFNNFLEIVKLEGSHDLRPVPDLILPCLEDAVDHARKQADAKGVHFSIRLLDDEMRALFDARGLVTCLNHLLENAIDYTAPGDSIELDARPVGDKIDISVFNRGDAPDQADVERLMQPFEQGVTAHNRTREGAGLGWAIVKLTCQAMGGRFGVISKKGVGLKAILRLNAVH